MGFQTEFNWVLVLKTTRDIAGEQNFKDIYTSCANGTIRLPEVSLGAHAYVETHREESWTRLVAEKDGVRVYPVGTRIPICVNNPQARIGTGRVVSYQVAERREPGEFVTTVKLTDIIWD